MSQAATVPFCQCAWRADSPRLTFQSCDWSAKFGQHVQPRTHQLSSTCTQRFVLRFAEPSVTDMSESVQQIPRPSSWKKSIWCVARQTWSRWARLPVLWMQHLSSSSHEKHTTKNIQRIETCFSLLVSLRYLYKVSHHIPLQTVAAHP